MPSSQDFPLLAQARPKRRRVTMQDVARQAGVGTITVSRALSDPQKVSPPLRTRIENAIRDLGYVPNRMAGSLSSQRSRVVPIIVPVIQNAVFSDVVEGLNDHLLAEGYQILLGASNYEPEREEALIAAFLGWTPQCIVVLGTEHTEAARRMLSETEVTVVELFELIDDPIEINIGFSHRNAARDMALHLVERGYRKVAFVGAFMHRDRRAAIRCRACMDCLREQGQIADRVLSYEERSTLDLGAQAICDVLDKWPDTDAVFFANDVLAGGALMECQRRGIAVPGRVAIAGFTGLPIGARTTPELTTVVSPRYQVGEMAARVILETKNAPQKEKRTIEVPYSLLIRQST